MTSPEYEVINPIIESCVSKPIRADRSLNNGVCARWTKRNLGEMASLYLVTKNCFKFSSGISLLKYKLLI